jgi:N-glycosylase/DNA lyase
LLRFRLPEAFHLAELCQVHGWVQLAPFRWDTQLQQLFVTLRVGTQAIRVTIRETQKSIVARLESRRRLSAAQRTHLRAKIQRMLSLDQPIEPLLKISRRINQATHRLVKQGFGRLLRGPTLWEDAAKTLFTTNCSWSLTRTMAEKSCDYFNCRVSRADIDGLYPFISPDEVVGMTANQLQKRLKLGYRSQAFLSLARYFVQSGANLENLIKQGDFKRLYNNYVGWKGYGEYAASHLLVLSGYFERIPYDTLVAAFYQEQANREPSLQEVAARYAHWKPYQYWGLKFDQMLNNPL